MNEKFTTHAITPLTFTQVKFLIDAIDQRTEGSQGDTTKRERTELNRIRKRLIKALQPESWEH